MEKNYISSSSGNIRMKIVHLRDTSPVIKLSDEEVDSFPGLREAFEQCRKNASAEKYEREYALLNPTPVVLSMKADDAERFVNLVMGKCGKSLYDTSITLMFKGECFLIAIEHECG